ncbi:FAD/NAD-P-binding domain-containing protein [Vararia minispora EC-137]|uniref:FAD/NAD-P-binding domain-containing protein n=1 Tax=Vararia minispora EC-137 TaxID=1314806 RepID=A0ACB8QKF1_9AGAM|nr:FAD/NAD-P-binding domain-containing protein [Vararia minispora EC-137]
MANTAPKATSAFPGGKVPIDTVPHLYGGLQTSAPLHIVVVGAGLGGLSAVHTLAQAGHRVTLLEAAPALGDVGAGIQVSPNASRLLIRWGLETALRSVAVAPEAIQFIRYSTGERVGYTRWGDSMEKEYGAPYAHIHRADYHAMLLQLALSAPGVTFRLNAMVVDVQPDPEAEGGVSVTLAGGEVISADMIVGADGVKSRLQAVVTGKESSPEPTGDAAYRAIIPADVMLADPDLKGFVEEPNMTGWMAPGRHLMAYCIRAKKEFNLVLLHPDDGSVESWTAEGSADKMRADFADFEPRAKKLLSFVDSTLNWRLMARQPLERWLHPKGRLVLLGDSCHPMLPYRAQGAAMAVEDAAVLGALLVRLQNIYQLPALLKAYESLRYARCTETQNSSRLNQHIFHLPDGPEQEARDASMRAAMELESIYPAPPRAATGDAGQTKGNQNQWADRAKSQIQFGYDGNAVANQWWEQHKSEVLAIKGERRLSLL